MARTTLIISDELTGPRALGASAKLEQMGGFNVIQLRIGDEVVRIVVSTDQAHGIAAAIASDLLACLPVVGEA